MADNTVQIVIQAKDQASQVLRALRGDLAGIESGLAGIGGKAAIFAGLAGGIALVGAGAVKMAIGIANDVEQLDRLSARSGVSIQNLQVMRRTIEEAGGNAESLSGALSFLNRALAQGNPLLAQIGITAKDAFGAMLQLGEAFSKSDDAAKKNLVAFQLLGRGGTELIADVEELSKSFDGMKGSMQASGLLMSGDTVDAARQLDAEMDDFTRNWEGFWMRIKVSTVPGVNAVVSGINKMIDAIRMGAPQLALANVFAPGPAFGPQEKPAGWDAAHPGGSGGPSLSGVGAGSGGLSAAEQVRRLQGFAGIRELQNLGRRGTTRASGAFPGSGGAADGGEAGGSGLGVVVAEWQQAAREISDSAKSLQESLGAVFSGLQRGFYTVFANLTNKSQTFKGAMSTIFRSLVDEILAQFARLAAAAAFKLVLRVAAAAATNGASEAGGGLFASQTAPGAPSALRTRGGAGGGGNTINVYAIDAQSMVQSMGGIGGSLRRANDQIRYQGAY